MQRHRQACCDRWSLTGVLFCAKRRCSCVCLHCLCPTERLEGSCLLSLLLAGWQPATSLLSTAC